ncbi:MAG: HDOD domain-containing protein [Candidatus Hydrogenedentes bacterium]|nr:HDOD domain-containing protein [Candidatus Hydrogenedentota bacterium]
MDPASLPDAVAADDKESQRGSASKGVESSVGRDRPASGEKKRIGEMLMDAGMLSDGQLKDGLRTQSEKGGKLVETLISLGYLDPTSFVRFLARQPGIASLDLSNYEVPAPLVNLVSKETALKHEVFPIDRLGKLLTLGMVCPLDSASIRQIEEKTGLKVKPLLCSAEDIRSAIRRYYPPDDVHDHAPPPKIVGTVHGLETPLRLTNVAHLIRKISSLPVLPHTVQSVREAMQNIDSSVAEVARIIMRDPTLAAKVLSVANSAAFGFPQRVDNITLAVSLLGLRETYSIVLSAAVINLFDKGRSFNFEAFWQEATLCAAASALIGKRSGEKHHRALFTAGLLHDIGRMTLLEVIPERYSKLDPNLNGHELIEAEEELVGLSHTEAGHELAHHWQLPEEIAEVIRFHHHPDLATKVPRNVAIVSLADAIVHAGPSSGENNEDLVGSCAQALEILQMAENDALALNEEFIARRDDLLKMPIS